MKNLAFSGSSGSKMLHLATPTKSSRQPGF